MDPTHDHQEHHAPGRTESAATYRHRRIAAGAGLALVLAVVVLGLIRLTAGSEATDALEPPGSTAVPTTGVAPGGDGDGDPSTTTTALVIPGFASPQAYLACVKDRESRGDYSAVSPDGQFFGAYQIDQVTWNNTAQHAGMLNVYEIQPNLAAPADQDALAMALLEWQGTSPWAGDC